MTIRSEAGGVDAADFAEMLMRMYLRWAERHGYGTDVYDTSYAEEAGIKSATFQVHAPFAYGTLSVEQGTHRLVRISPFDNQGRRQTSFAGVEVAPVVEPTDHVDIDEKDLRVDVYRSSGPGGQGVNTTDSAVRLTHLPTGIVVSCQNERSQLQNKASAMMVLQAKLLERRRQEEQAKMDALKDTGSSWGNQMRSYVLHPYQMVKDLRTEHEVGNPSAVLDGDIDGFIEAGIRWRRQPGDGRPVAECDARGRPWGSPSVRCARRDPPGTRHQALQDLDAPGARPRLGRHRAGGVRLPHRAVRLRQVDVPAAAAARGRPDQGHASPSRTSTSRSCRAAASPGCASGSAACSRTSGCCRTRPSAATSPSPSR